MCVYVCVCVCICVYVCVLVRVRVRVRVRLRAYVRVRLRAYVRVRVRVHGRVRACMPVPAVRVRVLTCSCFRLWISRPGRAMTYIGHLRAIAARWPQGVCLCVFVRVRVRVRVRRSFTSAACVLNRAEASCTAGGCLGGQERLRANRDNHTMCE